MAIMFAYGKVDFVKRDVKEKKDGSGEYSISTFRVTEPGGSSFRFQAFGKSGDFLAEKIAGAHGDLTGEVMMSVVPHPEYGTRFNYVGVNVPHDRG